MKKVNLRTSYEARGQTGIFCVIDKIAICHLAAKYILYLIIVDMWLVLWSNKGQLISE